MVSEEGGFDLGKERLKTMIPTITTPATPPSYQLKILNTFFMLSPGRKFCL